MIIVPSSLLPFLHLSYQSYFKPIISQTIPLSLPQSFKPLLSLSTSTSHIIPASLIPSAGKV
jgi:hypothetical protein